MPFPSSHRRFTSRFLIAAFAAMTAAVACSKSETTPTVEPPPPPAPPPPPPPVLTIGLNPTAIQFNGTIGNPSPSALTVAVSNTGTGTLSNLGIGTITYGAGASGWLNATLSGPVAPATLTLTPSNTGLAAGTYTATVPVASSMAANTPQSVAVSFTLVSPAPPPPPPPPPPPGAGSVTLLLGGNMGACNSGLARATASLIASTSFDYLFVLGDNVTPQSGIVATLQDYQNCYEPVFGQFMAKTYVALGELEVDGDTTSPTAGYANAADAYFGAARVGAPGKNYYSFDLGTWHIVVLNIQSGGPWRPKNIQYKAGSFQLNWLYQDLQSHPNKCTLAVWHDPMWMSSNAPPSSTDPDPNHGYRNQPVRGIWTALYEKNADLVVNSGMHTYERFAPMRYAEGYQHPTVSEYAADSARGIRQITTGLVGDGPLGMPPARIIHPLSEFRSGGNGVLKLVLGDGVYSWQFLNTANSNVIDSGTGTCH